MRDLSQIGLFHTDLQSVSVYIATCFSWFGKAKKLKENLEKFLKMGLDSHAHRSGSLKQTNKSHKTGRHRSKGAIDSALKGEFEFFLFWIGRDSSFLKDSFSTLINLSVFCSIYSCILQYSSDSCGWCRGWKRSTFSYFYATPLVAVSRCRLSFFYLLRYRAVW